MKHNFKIILTLVFLFLIAEIFGLFIVKQYTTRNLPYGLRPPQVDKSLFPFHFMLVLGLVTLLVFVLKKVELLNFWKVWFLLAVALATSVSLSIFMSSWMALLVAFAIAILRVKSKNTYVKNMSELLVYGGVVAIFAPIFTPKTILILMLLLAVYDIFSVFYSGHMVELLRIQEKTGLFSGLSLQHEGGRALLGGGDVMLPLLFAATVLKFNGLISALFVLYFSTLSLFLLLLFGKKEKYYPAVPILAFGSLVGYLVSLI